MALKHGVGLPLRAWRCTWGPHATTSPPTGGGLPCPLVSFIQPSADPWLRLTPPDPEHRISRTVIADDLFAPYLGLHPDRRCWKGGADAVSPHDTVSEPFLVQAFNAGNLGSPEEWDGQANEQEIYLLSVSTEAYAYVLARRGVPQQPPPPPPPPQPPPVEPPPPQPPPGSGLEQRVASLENWRTTSMDPNTLNQHPDFVGLVGIFRRRVEALEIWRDDVARPNLQRALDRIADLDARLQTLERGQPQPPPVPPPPPSGNEPAFTWKLDTPWTSTAAQPHRLLKVPFAGLARRITLSYRVDIPEVAAGQRQQVHAAYVDGSGRHGILSSLFVDGGRRSWVLRTNSAGASQPWVTATKAGLRPAEESAYLVRQDWMPGDNRVVAGSAGETTDRPLLALRMQQGLWVDLGYPATSVEGNPAEAYSLGWTWSDLEVKVWE